MAKSPKPTDQRDKTVASLQEVVVLFFTLHPHRRKLNRPTPRTLNVNRVRIQPLQNTKTMTKITRMVPGSIIKSHCSALIYALHPKPRICKSTRSVDLGRPAALCVCLLRTSLFTCDASIRWFLSRDENMPALISEEAAVNCNHPDPES